LRVLQLIDSLDSNGGLERFVYNFSSRLLDAGHETIIATRNGPPTHHWGDMIYTGMHLDTVSNSWIKHVVETNPDLVVWHGTPQMIPVVLELSTRYNAVATVHGVVCPSGSRLFSHGDELCYRKSGYGCLGRWHIRGCGSGKSPLSAVRALRTHSDMVGALLSCKSIYAVSESVRQFLLIEGVPDRTIHIFDNTLGSLADAQTVQLAHITNDRTLRLLYIGRLVYSKGVQYLIHAVHQMLAEGKDTILELAGDGWYQDSLRKLVNSLGIADHVLFLGKIPGTDVDKVYERADVVVVPSIWPDPAPLVVPEARGNRKPVVVSDAGGLPEWAMLLDGVFVAKRANVSSLKQTIFNAVKVCSSERSGKQAPKVSVEVRKDLVMECEVLGHYRN
jgi:glycosyltransferase involved in cell wall biosynthesis